MQNLPKPGYAIVQGRKPSLLRHVQQLRISPLCHSDQDRFLCTSRQEEEATGLSYHFRFWYGSLEECILYTTWDSKGRALMLLRFHEGSGRQDDKMRDMTWTFWSSFSRTMLSYGVTRLAWGAFCSLRSKGRQSMTVRTISRTACVLQCSRARHMQQNSTMSPAQAMRRSVTSAF